MADNKNYEYDAAIIGVALGENYGSVLTYYSLYETIKSFGKKVLMVSKLNAKVDGSEIEDGHATRFGREHYNLSKAYTLKTIKDLNKTVETFVIGSDQVWNYGISKGFGKSFYLDFVDDDKRKISYAASFGHAKDFSPEDEVSKISGLMKRFNAISVREDTGVKIARDVYQVPAVQVVEPIFLTSAQKYLDMASRSKKSIDEPYLLAYILDPTPEKKAAIIHIAKKLGLKIRIILDGWANIFEENKKKMDLDGSIEAEVDTYDFLKLYANSSYVITDSFHGTAFSLRFEKPFVSIGNARRGVVRFDSMFRLIGNKERFTLDPRRIVNEDARFLAPIDYVRINNLLDKHVADSMDWLKKSLMKPIHEILPDMGFNLKSRAANAVKNALTGSFPLILKSGAPVSDKKTKEKDEKISIVGPAKKSIAIAIPDEIPSREKIILDVISDSMVVEWKVKISSEIPSLLFYVGRELKEYMNNKVGGAADILAFPKTIDEIKALVDFSRKNEIPYTVLGRGSNVIVRDGGIRGITILMTELKYFKLENNLFTAGAGSSLIEAAYYLLDNGKSKLEWAAGIPGTIGGAVYMNAGTYTSDIRSSIKSVKVIDENGRIFVLNQEDVNWGVRYTSFQKNDKWIILEATFDVLDGNGADMARKMLGTVQSRENNMPLEHPNHGSTFKWFRAPRLIQQAGLVGTRIGGVKISEKQPGFFINIKQATASDYEALINYTIAKVYEFSGFLLEPEVEIIGEHPYRYKKYTKNPPKNRLN